MELGRRVPYKPHWVLRVFAILSLVATTTLATYSQSPSPTQSEMLVRLQYPNSPLLDVIKLYQMLTKRKVWIDAELRLDKKVSLVRQRDLPRGEVLSVIRGTLLEQGIEVREMGETEAFVERTKDPRILSLLPTPSSISPPSVRGTTPHVSPSP